MSQGSGFFSNEQLLCLRSQIMVFRTLKAGKPVTEEALKDIKAPVLQPAVPGALPGSAAAVARPGALPALQPPIGQPGSLLNPSKALGAAGQLPPHLRAIASAPAQAAGAPAAPAPAPAPAPPPPPDPRLQRGPLYIMAPGSGLLTGGAQLVHQQQVMFDATMLLAQEYRAMLARAKQRSAEKLTEQLRKETNHARRAALMVRLKRLKFADRQAQLQAMVEREQSELMAMTDRAYRAVARQCVRQRLDKMRAEERARGEKAAERVRAVKQWRADLAERQSAARELRVARNRFVLRAHERLARDAVRQKDDDRSRRMDALKAHDFEAYQEMLRETAPPGSSTERFEVISKFLTTTEEYLNKLSTKVASVKMTQEASEAAALAVSKARAQGMTEEEVAEVATAAAQEAANDAYAMQTANQQGSDAQSRYYALAHSVEEAVAEQPAMLIGPNGAKLREYQMVGLKWMVSLYNNHLNGILADEMGLGKTVQVMALIAYLMEHKNNYGPHLIIVPNAVMVNWKAELTAWLPSAKCVYYVGHKDDRARKFNLEVASLQFNVLVTTYEYIMRDRTKLSKVEWKYIVIDEAQRMKDRQSKLAKDLDRFTGARRLLLTGTPLQNELSELWSLLNLLLPEVFDDKATFAEWFGDALGKGSQSAAADEWLATEKRVVVIHRLHQILEPFMLRRQVQDVEGKLPPKVPVIIKVPMARFQGVAYAWIKATGTLRLDPDSALSANTFRTIAPLNNKVMELRKICNHPCLSYWPIYEYDRATLVHRCGKFRMLDRLLVKLHAGGHRVLLFSTMTKLLDLLEEYLRWRVIGEGGRRMGYLRIDGSTSLEDRESNIQKFNSPNSPAFIFLLSIRAAGRGLNLQSADTVIIYDPDANPKNEEQAIARSHRIGQTKEVRVIHFEAVVDADKPGTSQQEQQDGQVARYADSIESLVRNNIQKMKIDMANEVIDAGRFDMKTTMGERRQTLEDMLQDEERLKKAVNQVPSHEELNAMVARSESELQLFNQMDAELDWPDEQGEEELPAFLQYSTEELQEAAAANQKSRGPSSRPLAAALSAPPQAPAAPAEGQRPGMTMRQRSQAALSGLESSGLVTLTESAEDAAGGDDAEMEEEVVGNNIALDGSAAASRRLGSAQQSSGSPSKVATRQPSQARLQQVPGASGGAPPHPGAPESASAPMERPQHGSAEDLSSREPVNGQSQVKRKAEAMDGDVKAEFSDGGPPLKQTKSLGALKIKLKMPRPSQQP
ncbi:hypothetical protein CVIRNUC_010684 [Coccomyxa viridis]|uniref:Uncharacterized protein n=1 Tax=Coccomyxa viridis TaxID=1274662 RepID=A0AAV1IK04_9CHLO|nr:hypothetical protein CVIRNUC_010684 [Coccomyxa viridis]